jgi:nitrogen fixation NifU-like protein
VSDRAPSNREAQYGVVFDDLYRDLILDHYRNPRNKGGLEDAGVVVEGFNPSCGDEISVALRLDAPDGAGAAADDARVGQVRFGGQGCSISQSSASMLTEEASGRPIADVRALSRAVQRMLTDDGFDLDSADVGDLEALSGVARFPVRIKCALLAWKVLDEALKVVAGPDPAGGADDDDIQTRVTSA